MLKLKDKSQPVYFLLFIVIAFVMYAGTADGRLSSDFYNWVYDYEQAHWTEVFTCFGYPGLHQLYHIPFYFFYKIAGLNVWAWHILFVSLHALNAFLVLVFARKCLFIVAENRQWALLPALLFLVSPYQTEVVSWGACIHYLLMCCFLMSSLIFLVKYLETKAKKNGILYRMFFILALFCMEQSYLFPVIYIALALILTHLYKLSLKKTIFNICFSMIFIVGGYFIMAKGLIGSFIGHYGVEEHLHFDLNQIMDNLFLYMGKFIFSFRYIPSGLADFLHKLATNGVFQGVVVLLILTAYIYFVGIKRLSGRKKIDYILFFLLAFVCVLAPVLNIAMDSYWSIQTDRYSYVASPFFFLAVSFLLLYIRNTKVQKGIAGVLIILTSVFLYSTNQSWRNAGELKKEIIWNFPLEEKGDIYLLNVPENFNGAHLFRNGLGSALELHHQLPLKQQIVEVAKVNVLTKSEGLSIVGDKGGYKVELPHWGRWVHTDSYATEEYILTKTHDTGYTLEVMSEREDRVFMYLHGGEWRYIDEKD